MPADELKVEIVTPERKCECKPERSPAEKLAEDHWKYISGVLRIEYEQLNYLTGWTESQINNYINAVGFHYKTAFIHGYKHGQEEADKVYPGLYGGIE